MIEAIQVRAAGLTIKTVILTIVALLPFLVGWVVGFTVRGLLWLVAAVLAGYEMGRGEA